MPVVRKTAPSQPDAEVSAQKGNKELEAPQTPAPRQGLPEPASPLERHEGAIRALSAVIDGWRREFSDAPEPSERVEGVLGNLSNAVESLRFELKRNSGDFQTRMVHELKGIEGRLGSLQVAEAQAQDAFKKALFNLWNKSQDLETSINSIAGDSQILVESETEVLRSLQVISQQAAEGQHLSLERQEIVAVNIAGLIEALKTTLDRSDEALRQTQSRVLHGFEALDERMARRHEENLGIAERMGLSIQETTQVGIGFQEKTQQLGVAVQQAMASLEKSTEGAINHSVAQQEAAADELKAGMLHALITLERATVSALRDTDTSQATRTDELGRILESSLRSVETATANSVAQVHSEVYRELADVTMRVAQSGEEAKAATAKTQEGLERTLNAGLNDIVAAIGAMRADINETITRNNLTLMARMEVSEKGVHDALDSSADSIKRIGSVLNNLTDSLRVVRSEARSLSEQSEERMLHHLDSMDSRSFQTISDLRVAFAEERRASKLELQDRIEFGVTQPLKSAVVLLSNQLNDVEATLQRTLHTLKSADLMTRPDSSDARFDELSGSERPKNLVEFHRGPAER